MKRVSTEPIGGYVYEADAEHGPFAGASRGMVVRKSDRSSPWIVVDHYIESLLIVRWPGRLFRVVVLDAEGVEQVSVRPFYTRAVAVEIYEEVSVSRLFGDHGEAVSSVIGFAAGLDLPTARRLAENHHPLANEACGRAWDEWLSRTYAGTADRGSGLGEKKQLGRKRPGSPVNEGLSVIHRIVEDRAKALFGEAAFVTDEEGETFLVPFWCSVASALSDAALGMGAPSIMTEEDALILTAAWRAVVDQTKS